MTPESMAMHAVALAASVCLGAAVACAAGPIVAAWDRLALSWHADLVHALESLRVDCRPLRGLFRAWGLAMIATLLVLGVFLRSPILAVPLVAGLALAPRLWMWHTVASRRTLLRQQLVPAMTGLANTCRAGMPLPQGIRAVAAELAEPLRGEFEAIVGEHQGGRPLASSLADARRRLELEPFSLFVATIQTTLERGGRVTDMLERLSGSLREIDRLERTMDAATASHRQTIFILALFPIFFLLGLLLLHPDGTTLMFTTPLGQLLILMSMGLICGAVWWSQSLLQFRK